MTYLLLPIGFLALIKGADFLVTGASSIAERHGVSPIVIGLTVVAFGTSMPELVVSVLASVSGSADIAIGNVLGSNIANILLVLGASSVIVPLAVTKGTVWKEIPFSLLAITVLGLMVSDVMIDGETVSALTRIDGLVLVAFFLIFLYYVVSISKAEDARDVSLSSEQQSLLSSTGYVVAGLVGLTVGGKWVIDAAVALATIMGVSEALIGLTIVAVGTSLPELATSVVAASRGNVDIAVGNVVGSNIFNIFWVLGLSAIVSPLPFSSLLLGDVFVTVVATLLLFVLLFVGRRHVLERSQGIFMVLAYFAYIIYLVMRG